MKLRSFTDHLNEELKDPEFKRLYEEEKRLLDIAVEIASVRERRGLTQKELARQCRVTQQQVSKIENGVNCNVLTLIRVTSSLGLNVTVSPGN
ncbi:MAG: helix-turn-helix transcriptional regulator [Treponema sp.]|jgi:DNA-binding XRE family transcriptional regulator|nr:helix-turn-helix transcriptional regulator [Treponema sp.]